MKRLALTLALVVLVVLAAAGTAGAMNRSGLDAAMQRYALCRAPAGVKVAGGISSAFQGKVTYEILLTNKAALIVDAGRMPHRVRWITSHGVVSLVFRFRHLRNVPARLDAAC